MPDPLVVLPDKRHLGRGSEPLFLKGYSDLGALSFQDFKPAPWMKTLASYGVNLVREFCAPFPREWNLSGLQPFRFVRRAPALVPEFWALFDRLHAAASGKGVVLLCDLVDHYGLKDAGGFSSHPMAWPNGGPLKRGLPDVYDSEAVLTMIALAAKRMAGKAGVIVQVMNEPGGSSSVEQLSSFHKKAISAIRSAAPSLLVAINPVPDEEGRPLLPSPQEVGADLVTIHGAGVKSLRAQASYSMEAVKKRLASLQRSLRCPVISDTDGLRGDPLGRDNNTTLRGLLAGARAEAGFNHRDFEPVSPEGAPDLEALRILRDG